MRERYAAQGVSLVIDPTAAAGLAVKVDRHRIGQVLTNLLNNALRHTPAGGTVIISAVSDRDHVSITVSDNGDGMTPEQLEHAFERFYRADFARTHDRTGSGIGLTISRAIINAHGDLVDESDRGYRLLRKVLRSAAFYGLQKRLPLELLWKLARRSSDASKEYLAKPQEGLAAKMEKFALAKFAAGADAVILGHCHLPLYKTHEIAGRTRHFALLGDWLSHRSYLMLDGERFDLRFWDAGSGGVR